MKIITYNVNGIRSAMSKAWLGPGKIVDPDIICLQELKAQPDQLPLLDFEAAGYTCYHETALKKGYSGLPFLQNKNLICQKTVSISRNTTMKVVMEPIMAISQL